MLNQYWDLVNILNNMSSGKLEHKHIICMNTHAHRHACAHTIYVCMHAHTHTHTPTHTLTHTPSISYTDKTLQTVPLPTAGHMLGRCRKFHTWSAKTHTQRRLQTSEGSHLAAAPPLEPWGKSTYPSGIVWQTRIVGMWAKLYPMAKIAINIKLKHTPYELLAQNKNTNTQKTKVDLDWAWSPQDCSGIKFYSWSTKVVSKQYGDQLGSPGVSACKKITYEHQTQRYYRQSLVDYGKKIKITQYALKSKNVSEIWKCLRWTLHGGNITETRLSVQLMASTVTKHPHSPTEQQAEHMTDSHKSILCYVAVQYGNQTHTHTLTNRTAGRACNWQPQEHSAPWSSAVWWPNTRTHQQNSRPSTRLTVARA